jgi:hypothetical protein
MQVKELIQRVEKLEARLNSHPLFKKGWIKLSEAATILGMSERALRYQIELSEKQIAPYEEGIHWRRVGRGKRYQIHLERWESICDRGN